MTIDAVSYEEALERPELVVRRGLLGRAFVRLLNLLPGVEKDVERKRYTGRLLSHPEFEEFRRRFLTLEAQDEDAARDALWDFCIAQGIPPDKVLQLPGPVQEAVIADFFLSQARANGRSREDLPEAWVEKVKRVASLSDRGVVADRRLRELIGETEEATAKTGPN